MRARLAPAAVALALLAAGCSDGGDGEVSPTLPPITDAPSESPTAVAVPSEATAATPEGAAEFVRFYYAQLELAYAEADPALIADISAPDCSTCNNYVESLTDLRDSGSSVEPYSIRVTNVEPGGVADDAATTPAVVMLDISEYVRLDAQGDEVTREAPVTGAVQDVRLSRSGSSWLMQEITQ